jgi:hypothetical protein
MPLNLFVVVLLLKIKFLSSERVFQLCTGAHLVSFLSYLYFYKTLKLNDQPYRLVLMNAKKKNVILFFDVSNYFLLFVVERRLFEESCEEAYCHESQIDHPIHVERTSEQRIYLFIY